MKAHPIIRMSTKGDFKKANTFFEKLKETVKLGDLDKYGKRGVNALKANTPKDTGLTASSWSYDIQRENDRVTISWYNDNIVDYVNIAVILQFGHATKNGGWVEGRDYINPAMRPIFDEIADSAWKEVTKA